MLWKHGEGHAICCDEPWNRSAELRRVKLQFLPYVLTNKLFGLTRKDLANMVRYSEDYLQSLGPHNAPGNFVSAATCEWLSGARLSFNVK